MNVRTSMLAGAGSIALIMGNKWSPVFEAPNDQGAKTPEQLAAEQKVADDAAKAAKEAADKAKLETDKPSDREAELLKEQMKTKGKLTAANEALAAAQAELAKYQGIDPEKARQLEKAARDAEEAALAAKGDFEGVKKMMAEEHRKAIDAEKVNTAAKQSELDAAKAQIADLTIGQSFRDSTFIKDDLVYTPAKVQKIFGDHFAYEDGQVVAYDKPVSRKTKTKLVGADGNPLGFDAAIKKLVEADSEKDTMLKSKLQQGAGGRSDVVPPKTVDTKIEGRGQSRIAAALKAQQAKA